MTDLRERLDDLTTQAAGAAGPPPLADVVRRGRRHRQRQVAGAALVAAVVAALAMASVPVLRAALGGQATVAPASGGGSSGPIDRRTVGPAYGSYDARVFLVKDATVVQRNAVRAMLVASPAVNDVAYVSRQEAYRQFKELFADHPEMVAQVSEDAMTDSFLVVLNAPYRFGELNRALCPNPKRCRPGIDQVADESVLTKNLLVGTYWPARADVSVLLSMEVTDAQRRAVEARIRAIPMVASVTYEPGPQAFARLPADLRAGKDAPAPDSLPSSLRVALEDPGQARQFVLALCSSERTGDCAEGVAVVYKHPRRR